MATVHDFFEPFTAIFETGNAVEVHERVACPFDFYSEDQERDEAGRFGPGGGSSSEKDDQGGGGSSTGEVVTAIFEGREVELPANEVGTVLETLAAQANEAAARGEERPVFNLCVAEVPGTNLFCGESQGIPRQEMPQLVGQAVPGSAAAELPTNSKGEVDVTEAFKDALASAGYGFERETVAADTLKATQNELNGGKVGGIMGAIDKGAIDLHRDPIFVSKDGYVIDGHHRWAAAVGQEFKDGVPNHEVTMDVIRVDAPILEVLDFTNGFTRDIGLAQAGAGSYNPANVAVEPREEVQASLAAYRRGYLDAYASRRPFDFYSEEQARDELGRFGEGSGEQISALAGAIEHPIATLGSFDGALQEKIVDSLENRVGATQEQMLERYDKLMQDAMSRGSSWEEGLTWYQREHDNAMALARDHDVPLSNVVGGLAAMSAGTQWASEMPIMQTMLTLDSNGRTIELSQERLDVVNAKLAHDGLEPVANGMVYRDLDTRSAILAMHGQHQESGPGGWGAKYSFSQYERALDLVRGNHVDERLNGVKVREFYNNLTHPEDNAHVTIDVMMMRAASGNPKLENDSRITSYPSKGMTVKDEAGNKTTMTTAIGPTPALADGVREIAGRYDVTPLQAQAIIWVEWQAQQQEARAAA